MAVMDGSHGSRPLVVRHEALATFRTKLADAELGRPRFVLVEGEVGMGRTTLLDQFALEVGTATVLRASGDESETPLHYGVVEQLCRWLDVPLPHTLATLLIPQGFTWGDRAVPPTEPFAVGAALLEVLGELQARAPLVILVDDVHLADAPSQLALLFALRRLRTERVLAVLSTPIESTTPVMRGLQNLMAGDGGAKLRLPGLDVAQTRELGTMLCARPFSRTLAERLRAHTGGNPLHIRDLLEELGVDALDRAGHAPLPVPRSFSLTVRARMAACTAEAQRLLGAAAVAGLQCDFGLIRRLAAVAEPLVALEAAVNAGLVGYEDRQVRFLHPLTRAAVYHALGVTERVALHGRAAGLLDDEASTMRHRAAATEEDDALASALAALARDEATRGELSGAATLFIDAARLAPAGAQRDGHGLDAVECLLGRGDVVAAAALAGEVETYGDTARAHYVHGRLAHLTGRTEDAERLLRHAAELRPSTPTLAANVAAELAGLSIHLLRPAESRAWAEAAWRASAGADGSGRPLPCLALGLALTGRIADAIEIFAALGEPTDDPADEGASVLLGRSIVRLYSGRARQAHDDAARSARLVGGLDQPILRVLALSVAAAAAYRLGAWEDAVAHAETGLAMDKDADLVFPMSALHAAAVRPLVGFGRWEAAEAHASLAEAASRSPWDRAMSAMSEAVLAHARGRNEKALDAIVALRAAGPSCAIDEPDGLWAWQGLYIEASVALGRLDDAAQVLEGLEALAAARQSMLAMATASRLRGTLEMARGMHPEAHVAFRRSLTLCSDLPMPFDRAVIQAAYGAFLRRIGKRSAAVAELRASREGFERLGAQPWMDHCDREMSASGLTPRRRHHGGSSTLTPQEKSVAGLVAQGKSNRSVAADLVLSVNTVEYHLKNIYAKLGIRSRSELVLRFAARPDPSDPDRHGSLPRHGTK